MAHGDDPRLLVAISSGLLQILFQPAELISNLSPAVFDEEIKFCRKGNHVGGSDVEGIEKVVLSASIEIVSTVDHRESIYVVGKVAVNEK